MPDFSEVPLKGVFKSRYPDLKGSDWVRKIDPEDREAFIRMGLAAGEYGRLGGEARAQSAKRLKNGRFASNESE